MQGCCYHFDMLTFFINVFADTITCFFFALFVLATFDYVYVNTVRFRQNDCLCHFLELNYRGLELNFPKLAQLLIGGDRVKSRAYTKVSE